MVKIETKSWPQAQRTCLILPILLFFGHQTSLSVKKPRTAQDLHHRNESEEKKWKIATDRNTSREMRLISESQPVSTESCIQSVLKNQSKAAGVSHRRHNQHYIRNSSTLERNKDILLWTNWLILNRLYLNPRYWHPLYGMLSSVEEPILYIGKHNIYIILQQCKNWTITKCRQSRIWNFIFQKERFAHDGQFILIKNIVTLAKEILVLQSQNRIVQLVWLVSAFVKSSCNLTLSRCLQLRLLAWKVRYCQKLSPPDHDQGVYS